MSQTLSFDAMLNAALEAGKIRIKAEKACAENGGHFKDIHTIVNGKPAWKCRCGFMAVKTAKVWNA